MIKAAIFDAYGTLLDVHSAMARYASRLGENWQRISQDWRIKQIEYSWVRSLAGAGQHRDFWQVTRDALTYVAAAHGINDAALLEQVMQAYRRLDAYPEVPAMLKRLQQMSIPRAILSNGSPSMLADAVEAAGVVGLLDELLSVEEAGIYKPAPAVYRLATERFGCAPDEIAFLSSNPWDAFGAHVFGFRVFRVNRGGLPDEYGLRGNVPELSDLSELPDRLSR